MLSQLDAALVKAGATSATPAEPALPALPALDRTKCDEFLRENGVAVLGASVVSSAGADVRARRGTAFAISRFVIPTTVAGMLRD